MKPRLKQAFEQEMQLARMALGNGDTDRGVHHLERAHILGQRSTRAHVLTHAWMLRAGWQRRDGREVWGQLLRLPAALFFSHLWVPLGNTGGANVSAFKPMPLPDDLATLLNDSSGISGDLS